MIDADLNLLRVFDMLAEERSVTRAAERLGLTQSAVSHALRRLRHSLGDPLFVRGPGGLQPTVRATALAPQVRGGLDQLRHAVAPSAFDPAQAVRRFNLAAGSFLCAVLVPPLVARLRQEAPGLTIRVWNLAPDLLDALDSGRIDLAFTGTHGMPARIRWTALFHEEVVWIARKDSDLAAAPLDMEAVRDAPRVTLAANNVASDDGLGAIFTPDASGLSGALQSHRGPTVAVVYDASTAMAIVARSDAVALVPLRFAAAHRDEIAILGPRHADAAVDLAMAWHLRADVDQGIAWLRALVLQMVGEGDGGSSGA